MIAHGVWRYFRFCLSYRDVEELHGQRGVTLTDEAIRHWCRTFGQHYANQLRRRPSQATNGTWTKRFSLLIRNAMTSGEQWIRPATCLDMVVQRRQDKHAAKRFFRKLLKGLTYVPRVIITDKLKSYGAAKREVLPGVEHRQHRYLNNRAENSHQPTRQRERHMQGFKSPGQAQRFLAAYGPIAQHFRPRRHLLPACNYRQEIQHRFHTWREIAGTALVA